MEVRPDNQRIAPNINRLLITRLQQQGMDPEEISLFLRDLAGLLQSKPESDVVELNQTCPKSLFYVSTD
jgi:hypothetical protein